MEILGICSRYCCGLYAGKVLVIVQYIWFGNPFIIPAALQNNASFLTYPKYILEILFSARRGLFVWSPIVILSTVGFYQLYKEDKKLSLSFFLMFLLQILINASVIDWWCGWSFGMRRMLCLYPIFVLTLAVLLDSIIKRLKKYRYKIIFVCLPLVLIVIYSIMLFIAYTCSYIDSNIGTSADALKYYIFNHDLGRTVEILTRRYGIWSWGEIKW